MNKVYFIRHGKPDFSVRDDLTRPLTKEGIESSKSLVNTFKNRNITKMYSSPYKRSIDTICEIAKDYNLEIEQIYDFRERKIGDSWIEDFNDYSKKQWDDFKFKIDTGESLFEVRDRNIKALHNILNNSDNETIIIGTHGTALSTIINYYDETFGYEKFNEIKDVMPLIICMEFEGTSLIKFDVIEE